MSDDKQFERRIAALEYAVAELRWRLDGAGIKSTNWLQDIMNNGHDEDAMRELAEIVQANREAERLAAGADGNWIEQMTGSVRDGEMLQRAMEFAKAYRESDRPADEAGTTP